MRVFQYYGPVLDIIAKSSLKRKGQAFVVFDSEKSALEAVEEMNGFELYGKALKVSRAKTHSDETVKRKAAEMFEEHKRKRLMLKGAFPFAVLLRWAGTGSTTTRQSLTGARLQARRGRRKSRSAATHHRGPEAATGQVGRCGRPRRVRAAQQDAVPAEHPARRGRGGAVGHVRAVRGLQGSASRVGACCGVRRVRERAVRHHGQGGDERDTGGQGWRADEGHVSKAVGALTAGGGLKLKLRQKGVMTFMIPRTKYAVEMHDCRCSPCSAIQLLFTICSCSPFAHHDHVHVLFYYALCWSMSKYWKMLKR